MQYITYLTTESYYEYIWQFSIIFLFIYFLNVTKRQVNIYYNNYAFVWVFDKEHFSLFTPTCRIVTLNTQSDTIQTSQNKMFTAEKNEPSRAHVSAHRIPLTNRLRELSVPFSIQTV